MTIIYEKEFFQYPPSFAEASEGSARIKQPVTSIQYHPVDPVDPAIGGQACQKILFQEKDKIRNIDFSVAVYIA
jgi:hypothetical protein